MAQMPPPTQEEEQVVLIRGSEEYKEYMRHQGGSLKVFVNRLESDIATAGRTLLLLFLIYTTVKTGLDRMGVSVPIWVEIVMLSLQVAGVEGAVPGLSRQKADLTAQGKTEEAKEIASAITSTRWLALLTGVEIGLSTIQAKVPSVDWLSWTLIGYSVVLLLARLWLITKFLIAMAKIEQKGPKIISQAEYDRQQREAEQEQVRLDNAAIQASIDQALDSWTRSQDQQLQGERRNMQAQVDEALARWTAQQSQQIAEQFAALQLSTQQPALNVDELTASIFASLRGHFDSQLEAVRRQTEATKHLIEAQLSAQSEAPRRSNEAPRSNADASAYSRPEAASKASSPSLLRLPVNGDRAAQKAEALRLVDGGLSTYKAAEQTGIPSGTIQRWLKERKEAQERRAATQGQPAGEAREA